MPTSTDKILLALLVVFFLQGWRCGILRSLIGPFSFFACAFFAVLFFDLTNNIIVTSLIVLGGGFMLSMLLNCAIMIGRFTINKEFLGKIFLGSRILGGITNLVWQGMTTILIVVILTLIPTGVARVDKIQKDVMESKTYACFTRHIVPAVPALKDGLSSLSLFKNPEKIQTMASAEEYQIFWEDQKVQELVNDPEIQELIDKKDIVHLAAHPKLRTLLANEDAMIKFTKFSKKVYKETVAQNQAMAESNQSDDDRE